MPRSLRSSRGTAVPGAAAALLAQPFAASRPEALLLDFDGVIVDSIPIKVQAYLRIYEGESPEKLEGIREHQRSHGGVTRRLQFRHFENELFGRTVTSERIEQLSTEFTRLIHEAVVTCPLIPGALDLLRRAYGQSQLHVVSGTPQEELADIVRRRGLAGYFASIHGAPATKRETFATILRTGSFRAERVLAIGDAMTEYEAAASLGIPFLGVEAVRDRKTFPSEVPVVTTLEGVAEALGFE